MSDQNFSLPPLPAPAPVQQTEPPRHQQQSQFAMTRLEDAMPPGWHERGQAQPVYKYGQAHMTSAESFWYMLGCILGAGAYYFLKVPTRKALSEIGYGKMTGWMTFWYVLQCICFGGGYIMKAIAKKALTEVVPKRYVGLPQRTPGEHY